MFDKSQGLFHTPRQASADDSNMIPLINIVFLMLIFFMVAGKITAKDVAVFDAPTTPSLTQPPGEGLNLILAADGSLWLDAHRWGEIEELSETDWQQLEQALSEVNAISLKAEATLPASLIDPLLKRLRNSGAEKIQLAVQEAP